MTLMAHWNFHEAKRRQLEALKSPAGNREMDSSAQFRRGIDISGGLKHYEPARKLLDKKGDNLFFEKGLRIQTDDLDATLVIPNSGGPVKPHSLFYLDDGQLKEKVLAGKRIEGSILFWEKDGTYQAVLAHPDLIRSVLFRLYYLGDSHFEIFQTIIRRYDLTFDDDLFLYQVNWNKPSKRTKPLDSLD